MWWMMRNKIGFTLLEMLLVLVIATAIMSVIIGYTIQKGEEARRQKTVMQMQTVLNAAMAYYVQNGKWPTTGSGNKDWGYLDANSDLIKNKYLPPGLGANNAWMDSYGIPFWTWYNDQSGQSNNFYVLTAIPPSNSASANASIIAGQLPLSGITNETHPLPPSPSQQGCSGSTNCSVFASVSIPGQNLNNARSVNFADLYHSGGCVPVPSCPMNMTPQIFAIPVSVNGSFDGSQSSNLKVYPISGFSAYATLPGATPVACNEGAQPTSCEQGFIGQFWRVCLHVVTDKGVVSGGVPPNPADQNSTLDMGYILAITRCVPSNEPSGTDIGLW